MGIIAIFLTNQAVKKLLWSKWINILDHKLNSQLKRVLPSSKLYLANATHQELLSDLKMTSHNSTPGYIMSNAMTDIMNNMPLMFSLKLLTPALTTTVLTLASSLKSVDIADTAPVYPVHKLISSLRMVAVLPSLLPKTGITASLRKTVRLHGYPSVFSRMLNLSLLQPTQRRLGYTTNLHTNGGSPIL